MSQPLRPKRKKQKVLKVEPEQEKDCPVCYSHFTKHLRPPIKCPTQKCDFTACKQCVMRYLSEDTYDRAHCMSCKEPWLDDFVMDSCTKAFWKGPFKKHILRLVMDRERNLLPDTMPFVGTFKRIHALNERLKSLQGEKRALLEKKRLHCLETRKRFPQNKDIREIKNRLRRTYRGIDEAKDTLQIMIQAQDAGQDVRGMDNVHEEAKSDEAKEPLIQCPFDDCRGFLNRQRHCDICDRWVCGKCHKEKKAYSDEAHVCKEEDVASVKFIQKDAKPCPGCRAPIHKISGCYMMFCTSCHTAFDWKDLKILNPSNVHNPHMIEWMRNGGRMAGGMENDFHQVRTIILAYSAPIKDRHFIERFLWELHRTSNAARAFRQRPSVTPNDFRMARLNYLCGHLDEEKWSRRVRFLDRKMEIQTHENNLFEVYYLGISNIFTCLLNEKPEVFDLMREVEGVRNFFITQVTALRERGIIPEASRQINDVISDRNMQVWFRLIKNVFVSKKI